MPSFTPLSVFSLLFLSLVIWGQNTFGRNTNAYEYKEEVITLKEVYEIKDKQDVSNTNEIEDIFEDVIVYN